MYDDTYFINEALKEANSALEEGKADILGLYMVNQLLQKGELSGFSIEGEAGSDGEFHGLRFDAKPEDLAAIAAGFADATGCSNDVQTPAPAKS